MTSLLSFERHEQLSNVAAIMLSVVISLGLAGCLNYEQSAKINADGSGTLRIHYWTLEPYVTWLSQNKVPFSEDAIRQRYASDYTTIKAVRVETRESDSTRHVWIELDFSDFTKLNQAEAFAGNVFEWKHEDGKIKFRHLTAPDTTVKGPGLEGYTVAYEYKMPGSILSSNAMESEDKTLTWVYRLPQLSRSMEMKATIMDPLAGKGLTNEQIMLLFLGFVVLGVVLLFVVRKRR
ncbi:MAG: hypothetical protein GXO82_01910 [Chlorobi bacterium]|nr:hypothetical protein [Chlorobiota bacterium]